VLQQIDGAAHLLFCRGEIANLHINRRDVTACGSGQNVILGLLRQTKSLSCRGQAGAVVESPKLRNSKENQTTRGTLGIVLLSRQIYGEAKLPDSLVRVTSVPLGFAFYNGSIDGVLGG
jgi:hypothetical protein